MKFLLVPRLLNGNFHMMEEEKSLANGDVYEEWYQISEGKLISWSSAKRENK